MRRSMLLFFLVFSIVCLNGAVYAAIIRVKTDGNDSNNGSTWTLAKKTVKAAINAAGSGSEVWVAKGAYVERFGLKEGVGIYGGFAGNESQRDQRNWYTNVTTIDGNHAGPVVYAPVDVGPSAVIDGFTIRNGLADDGAGIDCYARACPTISNNIITGNEARIEGAGIFCTQESSPIIRNNTITSNSSSGKGGGISCYDLSAAVIEGNTITQNWAGDGGAIYSLDSSPSIMGNDISRNSAEDYGGAIYTSGGAPEITDNRITDNGAHGFSSRGGGIYCSESAVRIQRNTITGNSTSGDFGTGGGGLHVYGDGVIISDNIIKWNWTECNYESYGAGVACGGSVTIERNLVAMNCTSGFGYRSWGEGGGIYSSGTAMIVGNEVVGNVADYGGAIDHTGSATISNNVVISNNTQGGIGCGGGVCVITNNTVVYNSGGGVGAGFEGSTIANNLVAFNEGGIYSFKNMVRRNNCVFGNGKEDAVPAGDIFVDPRLAGGPYGNIHLQAGSPCIDAGWNSAPALSLVDMDGQTRVVDGDSDGTAVIDIGADESDGTIWPPGRVIRVAPDGSDENDGSSWSVPMGSVRAAAEALTESGGEVWVKAGAYYESVSTGMFVHLYGGFAGNEENSDERDPAANTTVLDGDITKPVVSINWSGRLSTLDGFTIRNGLSGVRCHYASPTIANNTIRNCGLGISCDHSQALITGNAITMNSAGIRCYESSPKIEANTISNNTGSGIFTEWMSSPTIVGNLITGNTAQRGGGIYKVNFNWPYIAQNTITDNEAEYGGGIYAGGFFDWPETITRNTITGNRATYGGGICAYDSIPDVTSNLVASNHASVNGGGLYVLWLSPSLAGNTIVANTAEGEGGGIFSDDAWPTISSNIVAFNSSGIAAVSAESDSIGGNCVFGNTTYDYSGASPGQGDIAVDPGFVDRTAGDYHLASGSPCINAGLGMGADYLAKDFDGDNRIIGGIVDIGMDEYPDLPPPVESVPAAKQLPDRTWVHVKGQIVTGNFYGTGLYVESPSRESGILVKQDYGPYEGSEVEVDGVIRTGASGERYIDPAIVIYRGTGHVDPLAVPVRSLGGGQFGLHQGVLGGVGLTNIGLLVKTWGRVTAVGSGYLYIDDGSGVKDGTYTGLDENTGVRVICYAGDYSQGDYLAVTGISSCFRTPTGDIARRILTRGSEDISRVVNR